MAKLLFHFHASLMTACSSEPRLSVLHGIDNDQAFSTLSSIPADKSNCGHSFQMTGPVECSSALSKDLIDKERPKNGTNHCTG